MSDGTADAAATAAAADDDEDDVCSEFVDVDEEARAGGSSGECELAEVLVDAASGTPVAGYKS
jgi:hypothetical protein